MNTKQILGLVVLALGSYLVSNSITTSILNKKHTPTYILNKKGNTYKIFEKKPIASGVPIKEEVLEAMLEGTRVNITNKEYEKVLTVCQIGKDLSKSTYPVYYLYFEMGELKAREEIYLKNLKKRDLGDKEFSELEKRLLTYKEDLQVMGERNEYNQDYFQLLDSFVNVLYFSRIETQLALSSNYTKQGELSKAEHALDLAKEDYSACQSRFKESCKLEGVTSLINQQKRFLDLVTAKRNVEQSYLGR